MDRSFSRFVTIHAIDRRTDGRTDSFLIARPRLHSMQGGNKSTKIGNYMCAYKLAIYLAWGEKLHSGIALCSVCRLRRATDRSVV